MGYPNSAHSQVCSTREQKLNPQRRIALILTSPQRRARQGAGISDSPHLHAEMMRFQVHRQTVWLEHRIEAGDNLLPQPFLDRETLRKQPYQPRQFGDADDVLVRDIAPQIHSPAIVQIIPLSVKQIYSSLVADDSFNDRRCA